MKKIILFAFLAGLINSISAQSTFEKGYIITLNGDTLQGQIKYNPKNELPLFDVVSFQTNPSDKKSYHANKIKEFSFDGNVYVARMIEDKAVFVKRLSAGAINLYEYRAEEFFMNNVRVNTNYYMEKIGNIELVHIKESKFKKQIIEIMADDESVIKDLHEKKYEYANIVDLFEQYNRNKDGSSSNKG